MQRGRESETAVEPAVIAQAGILDFLLAVAHPVPGIVALLAHDFLETTADEELHAVEAGLIHVAQAPDASCRWSCCAPIGWCCRRAESCRRCEFLP